MAQESTLQVLGPGVGYGIIIGIGIFFAAFMIALTYLQNRYTLYSSRQAEEFSTASRNVKPGLIAAGIVSSWTWPGTLLTSSTVTTLYGISGPFTWACFGCFQISLFALLAVQIKRTVPGTHTYPEMVLAKHGVAAHVTYLFYGLITNVLVGASLVLGGSQVVAALSGVNVYAANFIIPFVVAAYVVAGGLRSTFIADYAHTVILILSIIIFCFVAYATGNAIGSPHRLYDLLLEAGEKRPIPENHNGSYLTFRTVDGMILAVDLLIGGIAVVWTDQTYWQRAIASKPETSVKAYLFGAAAWFGMPFSFGTAMGLGCAALTGTTHFPTYPLGLSAAQVGAGLSAPATAVALLGKGGAALLLLLLFMSVTSATSAELIAVSSLLTFDMYKTYIKPSATSKQLVRVSHIAIIIYAVFLASFCSLANGVGINLTWLLTVGGTFVSGASIPLGLILWWPRMSTTAAFLSPWLGCGLGLTAWFVTTHERSGIISVLTTGESRNAIAGGATGFGVGGVSAILLSFLFPKQFHSTDPRHIARNQKIFGHRPAAEDPEVVEESSTNKTEHTIDVTEESPQVTKQAMSESTYVPTGNEVVDFLNSNNIRPLDDVTYKKAFRLAAVANIFFFGIGVIIFPFVLFGTSYTASRSFFNGWIGVSFLWVWITGAICVIWPVFESRKELLRMFQGLVLDISGARSGQGPRPDAIEA